MIQLLPGSTAMAAVIALCHVLPAAALDVPTTIQDLRVTGGSETTITLEWSAPEDPEHFLDAPEIAFYLLHYSPYDPADYGSLEDWYNSSAEWPNYLLPRGDGLGNPAPGTPQSGTITGLTKGQAYHFAIKSVSYWLDISEISNLASDRTRADWVAPGAFAGFEAVGSADSVTIKWMATGDDDLSGTVASVKLRYSLSAITPYNFDLATPVPGTPGPDLANTPQSVTIFNLAPDLTYYFAIEAWDEEQNSSGLSGASAYVGVLSPSTGGGGSGGGCGGTAAGHPAFMIFAILAPAFLRRR